MSRALEQTVPNVGVDHSGGDRAQRRLARAVGPEQRDDLAGARVAGRRRGAPRRRRSRRRRRRIASAASGSRCRVLAASGAGFGRRRGVCDDLVLGHAPSWAGGLGRGDRAPPAPWPASSGAAAGRRARGCRRAPGPAGWRRAPTGSARSRSTRSARATVPPPRSDRVGDPVEDRGPRREREAGEERATGPADPERHREREPEQPDVAAARWCC